MVDEVGVTPKLERRRRNAVRSIRKWHKDKSKVAPSLFAAHVGAYVPPIIELYALPDQVSPTIGKPNYISSPMWMIRPCCSTRQRCGSSWGLPRSFDDRNGQSRYLVLGLRVDHGDHSSSPKQASAATNFTPERRGAPWRHAEQGARRASRGRSTRPQRHLLGAAIRRTMARSAGLLRSMHHLLQPLRPVAKGRNMGPDHGLTCRRS